ncbi:GLUT4 regulating protein TUG-domain-containing protein [Polychytrium aggregatum]|uniref:GLUT4 regulating protein TUG-domain-containing protein n=1 Tax=Polychytrium aggregatum TaxID=110093 RepID=UPI0022FEA21B|nr:GLUT4 regulating protein TUG-domain-containing protein [Polychytrium aggregatum]KAI9209534.1 GLUT4 regulating protein TUG-domain-containing protein [Polychytrium aggregatum]
MSSSVIVEHEFRKLTVKTTPAMSVRSILSQACQQFGLSEEQFALKYNKKILDPSLSVRFANLPASAKLSLVASSTNARPLPTSEVTIALQLDDGSRLVGKFTLSTTLWDILSHFESKSGGSLVLTTRTGIPTPEKSGFFGIDIRKKTPVYMIPVCILMNQEFSTIAALQNTTLLSAGISSGNTVIRVLFKYTQQTLESALQEIVATAPAAAPATAPVAAGGPMANLASENASVSEAPPAVESAPAAALPSPTLATQPVNAASSVEQQAVIPQQHPVAAAQPPTELQVADQPLDTDMTEAAVEDKPAVFNRDIKVFAPPPEGYTSHAKIDLPDSFFTLTSVELKQIYDSAKQHRQEHENAPLKTRYIREKEMEAKMQKYPKTLVRVRFMDRSILQATFRSVEPVSELFKVLEAALAVSGRAFHLVATPPHRNLSPSETFWTAQLSPASIVHFHWTDGPSDGPYLSADYLARMEPFPLPDEPRVGAGSSASAMQVDSVGVAASPEDDDQDDRHGDEAARQRRQGGSQGGSQTSLGDGSSRKDWRPKWFKQ